VGRWGEEGERGEELRPLPHVFLTKVDRSLPGALLEEGGEEEEEEQHLQHGGSGGDGGGAGAEGGEARRGEDPGQGGGGRGPGDIRHHAPR
jgi:hypothetical protein